MDMARDPIKVPTCYRCTSTSPCCMADGPISEA